VLTVRRHSYFLTTLKIRPQYIKQLKENKEAVIQPKSQIESGVESGPLRIQILHLLKEKEHSKKEMAISSGHKKTYRHLDETVRSLVEAQMIAYTISDKPQSRVQEYRLTDKGRKWLEALYRVKK
jgi:ATP-dependent DNA helicase RecG